MRTAVHSCWAFIQNHYSHERAGTPPPLRQPCHVGDSRHRAPHRLRPSDLEWLAIASAQASHFRGQCWKELLSRTILLYVVEGGRLRQGCTSSSQGPQRPQKHNKKILGPSYPNPRRGSPSPMCPSVDPMQ